MPTCSYKKSSSTDAVVYDITPEEMWKAWKDDKETGTGNSKPQNSYGKWI